MDEPPDDPYQPPRAPVGLDREERAGAEVPEGSPWATIWTRPRGTIRGIVDSDPTYAVLPLAMLSGFSNALAQMSQQNAGDNLSPAQIVLAALLGGSIGGIVSLYLMALLVRWTGSWLGGTGNTEEARAALAWSAVPTVAALPILLLSLALFGQDYFRTGGLEAIAPPKALFLPVSGAFLLAFAVWNVVLNVKCVAEIHRFSAWRGLGTILLAVVVLFAMALALVFAIVLVMTAMRMG